jgi:hypothetical protein
MRTNKNAIIRYQTLDKCFRDHRHRYYIEDLIEACDERLCYYNGVGGVSRRQIFEDIKFMESEIGWSIPLERIKDGKRVYYRYEEKDFSINKQPLTDAEAQQLHTLIQSLSRFRGIPSNEWIEDSKQGKVAFVRGKWCGDPESEEILKAMKITIRCIPFDQTNTKGECLLTGKEATMDVIYARSY